MKLAHHAIDKINEVDINDAPNLALEAFKHLSYEVDFIDIFCGKSV